MDRIRLIASDMDATLLDEYSQLPPKFTETIRALAGQGILFAAASGRPLYTLETMFPDLLEEIILIGDNGGAARWKGKDLFVSEMPAEGWRQLARSTKQAGDVGLLCGLQAVYAEKRDEKYDAVFKIFYTRVEYVDDLTAVEAAADKFTIYLPNDDSQEAFDRTYGAFHTGNGGAFSVAVAGRNWVDVMNPGVQSKTSLKKLGAGAACCAMVVFSAMLGRFISTRTVAVAAPVNRIESAQDIQTWFTGYGLEVDGASITADKVKIPRRWDDSFSAFNGVVQQSGMDLARYKGKTVEKWTALIPAASNGETSRYGVLLVYKKKAVGAYLLEKPSGTVLGLQDAQNELAKQTSGEDYSGDWGERHDEQLTDSTAQQTSGEPEAEPEAAPQAAPYTELPLDAEGYPVE